MGFLPLPPLFVDGFDAVGSPPLVILIGPLPFSPIFCLFVCGQNMHPPIPGTIFQNLFMSTIFTLFFNSFISLLLFFIGGGCVVRGVVAGKIIVHVH